MGPSHAFVGGRILGMDPRLGELEVLVIEDGRIAASGERGILARYPQAVRYELGGRSLVPGFIDAHNHLSIAALHPLWGDLGPVGNVEELGAALREQAAREPEAAWIRGFGWNELNGLQLTRHDLDALGFDRPVLVAHYSLHQGVACSSGLDRLGVGRSTPDPEGGRIERGPDGQPTGLLVERAWSAAHAASVEAYRDSDRFAELFEARARSLLRDGITCIHDAACSPSAEATYARLAHEGRLPISVVAMPHAEALLSRLDASRLDGPRTGEGDERLRTGAVKLFADGGVEPAIDVCLKGTPFRGGMCFGGLGEDVARVVGHGFGVAVHAIGNVGLRETLEAFRRVRGRSDQPLRIEHAMLASRAQLATMAELEVIGVVQPGFVRHVGAGAAGLRFDDASWLPFADMHAAGVRLAASSDDPCAFHEPLLTSACGTTRISGSGALFEVEQALPYEEWLRAYTLGAAHAGGQEDERGSLAVGKRADLAVLEGDLDAESPPRVSETWVAGERVFAA